METEVGGTFVKIVFARDVDLVLARGVPARPPARFNRLGEDALYLSPDEETARIALRRYVGPDDAPRVLLTFAVSPYLLFDLRHPDARDLLAASRQPWQEPLARGDVPPSWHVADTVRRAGHAGLIDPSRQRPDLWHVVLFRWNAPEAPAITIAEAPRGITL